VFGDAQWTNKERLPDALLKVLIGHFSALKLDNQQVASDIVIARGDTLVHPAFIENDRMASIEMVLANPPCSIKQWNRQAWTSGPWGRNLLGTPPQGRAYYAFFQHILKSMADLFPAPLP
jgi:type I restriction-modification system DNA methylase subunit